MKLRNSSAFSDRKDDYLEYYFPNSSILFFDIETTGLSWKSSHLYMIGAAFRNGSSGWSVRQWFLDVPSEEKEMLEAFSSFLNRHLDDNAILIHYNGTGFDIPYLRAKYRYYKIPDPFVGIEPLRFLESRPIRYVSFDLYRQLRSVRKVLPLKSWRQKDLEHFLGIRREDRFSGKELIDIYHRYLSSGNPEDLELLFLHNYDDVRNMIPLQSILAYTALFHGDFHVTECTVEEEKSDRPMLSLRLRPSLPLPVPLYASDAKNDISFSLEGSGTEACLRVACRKDEMKRFFSDYKNYYYLPAEDTAIHKSVGQFVDPDHRIKAKAADCYQRITGIFVPQFSDIFTPVFHSSYRSSPVFFRYSKDLNTGANREKLHYYAADLLERLRTGGISAKKG